MASPAALLAGIKMPLSSKLTVFTGFSFRLLYVTRPAPSALRLTVVV